MTQLQSAITIVEILVATVAAMIVGDYAGHKIGRGKLAAIGGGIALAGIVVFAIYAAVILA